MDSVYIETSIVSDTSARRRRHSAPALLQDQAKRWFAARESGATRFNEQAACCSRNCGLNLTLRPLGLMRMQVEDCHVTSQQLPSYLVLSQYSEVPTGAWPCCVADD